MIDLLQIRGAAVQFPGLRPLFCVHGWFYLHRTGRFDMGLHLNNLEVDHMSANTPQTKEQILASKEKLRFRLLLLIIIIATTLVVAMLNWMGFIKPVAAADLSNGAFCVKVTNDKEPDITGMAGARNCGSGEGEPPVVTPPVKTYGQITVGRGMRGAQGYNFLLTVRNNPEGATAGLRVSCHASTVDDGAAFKTVTASIPATGPVEINCPFNTPGAEVWVSIEGHAYTKTVW